MEDLFLVGLLVTAFFQIQVPAIVVTPVQSADDTASLQNSTDAASPVLLPDRFLYIRVNRNGTNNV